MSHLKPVLEKNEQLLWAIMHRLEALAHERYCRLFPSSQVEKKTELLDALDQAVPDKEVLRENEELDRGVSAVVDNAKSSSEDAVLCVQGLLLEQLGRTIYSFLVKSDVVSPLSRKLAELGNEISLNFNQLAAERLGAKYPDGEQLFQIFADTTKRVLGSLDQLGGGIDKTFGDRYGLTFGELLSEFTSELLPLLSSLGMNRRRVVCHFTGSFMNG